MRIRNAPCRTSLTAAVRRDPEELYINREEHEDIEDKMAQILSELERKVLMLYLDGRSTRRSPAT